MRSAADAATVLSVICPSEKKNNNKTNIKKEKKKEKKTKTKNKKTTPELNLRKRVPKTKYPYAPQNQLDFSKHATSQIWCKYRTTATA